MQESYIETVRAADLAQKFHESYERLAPKFGYETRKESAKPWADVPKQNQDLMTAVCAEMLRLMVVPDSEEYVAWCRYTERGAIVTCDSDAPKAFKVYRHPAKWPVVHDTTSQKWAREEHESSSQSCCHSRAKSWRVGETNPIGPKFGE